MGMLLALALLTARVVASENLTGGNNLSCQSHLRLISLGSSVTHISDLCTFGCFPIYSDHIAHFFSHGRLFFCISHSFNAFCCHISQVYLRVGALVPVSISVRLSVSFAAKFNDNKCEACQGLRCVICLCHH